MRINTKVIKSLNPCKDRLDNYLKHYRKFNGTVEDFFALTEITHHDKLWVVLRLVSDDIKTVFALDCAFAYAAADAAYAAYDAAYAAADAAYAAYADERERQLDALLYLIKNERN